MGTHLNVIYFAYICTRACDAAKEHSVVLIIFTYTRERPGGRGEALRLEWVMFAQSQNEYEWMREAPPEA